MSLFLHFTQRSNKNESAHQPLHVRGVSMTTRQFVNVCLLFLLWATTTFAETCGGSKPYVLSVKFSFVSAVDARIPDPDQTRIPILVAVAHSPKFILFREAQQLNDTVAEVVSAGTGRTLKEELEIAVESEIVRSYAFAGQGAGESTISPDGTIRLQLTVRDEASRISVVGQLSPSPAWFVGIDSYDLCRQVEEGRSSVQWVSDTGQVVFTNFDGGLDKGRTFDADPDPYEDESIPVSQVDGLRGKEIATMSLVQGTLNSRRWWHIALGVLLSICVLVFFLFFVFPRLRRRLSARKENIPLSAEERVGW